MNNTTTLAIACSTAFIAQLGISIYLPALPAIALDLHAPGHQVALALAVYLIGMAAPMLLWGSLGERFGRKPVLIAALLLYGLSSLAIPAANRLETFLALRLIQGLGAGGISVMARVLIRDSFSGSLLAKGLSWLSIAFVVSLGIGQYLGSVLLVVLGWESIFYLLAAVSATMIVILLRVPFVALVKQPTTQAAWRLYGQILRTPGFLFAALAGGLGYGVIIAFNTGAPLILQGPFGWSATEYGLLGWGISAAYFLGALVVNRFVVRTGQLRLMSWGIVLLVCGTGTMWLSSLFGSIALLFWLPYCVAVFGQSLNYPISLSVANDHSPVSGSYAMALSGFMHQLMAAGIGGIASLLGTEQAWPLALMCLVLAAAALMCVVIQGRAGARPQ